MLLLWLNVDDHGDESTTQAPTQGTTGVQHRQRRIEARWSRARTGHHCVGMLQTIDRLLVEASPASTRALNRGRIVKREPIHQLVALLPHLTEAQQVLALRRLQQLLGRSLYNLNVCTAGLQLVSVILRWLRPDAPPMGPAVVDEVLALLAMLGGYRATANELRTLFELLQTALTPGLPALRAGRATAEQLLELLTRWCEPSA